MTSLVILVGHAGSGKSTAAEALRSAYGASLIAQADPIKSFARDVFGFTRDQLHGPSEQRNTPLANRSQVRLSTLRARFIRAAASWLGYVTDREPALSEIAALHDWFERMLPPVLYGDATARHVLQQLGTEFGRDVLGSDVWVKHAIARARRESLAGAAMVVITDGRFANEVAAVHDAGGVSLRIRALRLDDLFPATTERHASEIEQDNITCHAMILNDKIASDGRARFADDVVRVARSWLSGGAP